MYIPLGLVACTCGLLSGMGLLSMQRACQPGWLAGWLGPSVFYKSLSAELGPPFCTRDLHLDWASFLYRIPPTWICGLPVHGASYPDLDPVRARGLPAWLDRASCLWKGLPAELGPPVCTRDLHMDWGLLSIQGTPIRSLLSVSSDLQIMLGPPICACGMISVQRRV